MFDSAIDLAGVFRRAQADLELERDHLNQMDEVNHNHGDHMVAIFHSASQAAAAGSDLPAAMALAAGRLRQMDGNGSAQMYARGLECLAAQLEQRKLGLADLLAATRAHLSEEPQPRESEQGLPGDKQGDVIKALLHALNAWEQAEPPGGGAPAATEQAPINNRSDAGGVDLGYLFGLGMAYLQAKQQGGGKLDVLAETMVSASPLGRVPHRRASGIMAVRSMLAAMRSV